MDDINRLRALAGAPDPVKEDSTEDLQNLISSLHQAVDMLDVDDDVKNDLFAEVMHFESAVMDILSSR